MSVWRKLMSALTLTVAVFALSTFVSAQETTSPEKSDSVKKEKKKGKYGRKGMRGKRGRGMRGFRSLNLDENQMQQFRALMEKHRSETEGSRKEMREIMMARRSGLMTEAQGARLKELRDQRKADRQKFEQSFMTILNDEQRQKYEAQKAERKKRMEQWKNKRKEYKEKRKKTASPQESD